MKTLKRFVVGLAALPVVVVGCLLLGSVLVVVAALAIAFMIVAYPLIKIYELGKEIIG